MISRQEAKKKLLRYWQVEELKFKATFRKVEKEDKSTYGFFSPFSEDFPNLRYPATETLAYRRQVSLFHRSVKGFEDGEVYWVELELHEDKFREKEGNPYFLKIKNIDPLESNSFNHSNAKDDLTKIINEIRDEYLSLSSPYLVINQANSLNILSTDIYSENTRFIYELIQNADDAAKGLETTVDIQIVNKYVIISHHGNPFTPRDLRGVCGVGLGMKSKDITKTGYKGIGFKSVFGQPDGLVYVKSADVLFKFDKNYIDKISWKSNWGDKSKWEDENSAKFNSPWQVIPILCDQTDDPEVNEIIANADFEVRTIIKVQDPVSLFKDLRLLFDDARVLLFLRRVSSINLHFGKESISIKKTIEEKSRLIHIYKNKEHVDTYYVYKRTLEISSDTREKLKADTKTPDKFRNMTKAEFSIAICLDQSNNRIRLLKKSESPIYSFLPTSDTDYEFPFLVNANFILDASRQKISKDHLWNSYLFKVIGNQLIELCSELAENKLYSTGYLNILSNGYFNREGLLYKEFDKGLKLGIKEIPFILNKNEELVHLHDICIDDLDLISNKVSSIEDIVSFLSKEFNKEYSEANFFTDELFLIPLRKFDLFSLSRLDNFLATFLLSDEFGDKISLLNNIYILKYLNQLDTDDISNDWNVKIIHTPFILNSKHELRKIPDVCYPANTFDQDPEFENELIHDELYDLILQDKALKNWLDALGVTEPSSIAYLEKEIINKFPSSINSSNYLKVFEFIINLEENNQLKDIHYSNLQELPLKTEVGFKPANEVILSKAFNPNFDFDQFKNSQQKISSDYLIQTGENFSTVKSFFEKIGVTSDIQFQSNLQISGESLPLEFKKYVYDEAKISHSYPHLVGVDYVTNKEPKFFFENFSFIEQVVGIKEWIIYWNYLLNKYSPNSFNEVEVKAAYSERTFKKSTYKIDSKCLNSIGEMTWGRYASNRIWAENYLFWRLGNDKIIPTLNHGLEVGKHVYTNSSKIRELAGSYLPIIDLNQDVPDGWRKIFGLKTEISTEVLFQILTSISKHERDASKIKSETRAQIGNIYNTLIERLKVSQEKIKIISIAETWLQSNKLLGVDYSFRNYTDLIWLKASNLEINNKAIRSIHIPKNVNQEDDGFIELLQILKIRIVESLEYEVTNVYEDIRGKLVILRMLPFITLIQQYLHNITDSTKFLEESINILNELSLKQCDRIESYFIQDNNRIEGDNIKYYVDQPKNEIFCTDNIDSGMFRLDLSSIICRIFKTKRINDKIVFGLSIQNDERKLYLKSLKIPVSEIEKIYNNECYLRLVDELETLLLPTQVISRNDFRSTSFASEQQTHIIDDNIKEDIGSDQTNYIQSEFTAPNKLLSEEEEEAFVKLFGYDLDNAGKELWNSLAIFKALKYHSELGLDVSKEEENIDRILLEKCFTVDDQGMHITIHPRSAKNNILFVSINLWNELLYDDCEIFVLGKNNKITIFKSVRELISQDRNLIIKIGSEDEAHRLDIVERIFNLQNVEEYRYDKLVDITLLVRLNDDPQYKSIFDDMDF